MERVYREFPGRRLLIALLRVLHLAGVVGVGAAVLGAPLAAAGRPFAALLLASGLAMAALDVWSNPGYLKQFVGAALAVKLLLIALWLALPSAWLFWALLGLSSLTAHAPARVRHRRLLA